MAKMREIKLRIDSVKKTKQITKAMKLISVSKMKKARKQYEDTLPFYNRVKEIMAEILNNEDNIDNIFFEKKKKNNKKVDNKRDGKKSNKKKDKKLNKKKAYFVLSGDKGLAGGYNNNIAREVQNCVEEGDRLYVAGYFGRNYFIKKGFNVDIQFDYPVQNPTLLRAGDIAELFLTMFKRREIDELYVVYTKMVSGMIFEAKTMKLLPFDLDELIKDIGGLKTEKSELKYEPSVNEVFRVLLEKYVKGILYGLMIEAFVSEQTSRMTAMDSATRNADKMIKDLNLYYNRARQAAITQEITEIVGGVNGL